MMQMELAIEKIEKAINNLSNALVNLKNKETSRLSIGDLNYAKENIEEAKYIISDEINNSDLTSAKDYNIFNT